MPDDTLKHLEFIQAVVGRLGNNGFLVKGWAITVTGVFFGFAIESNDWRLGLLSLFLIVTFWGIDAYFLRSERLFRALYAEVAGGSGEVAPFYMAATSEEFRSRCKSDVSSYWRTVFGRPVLLSFYGVLLASGVVVVVLVLATPAAGGHGDVGGPAVTDSLSPTPHDPVP